MRLCFGADQPANPSIAMRLCQALHAPILAVLLSFISASQSAAADLAPEIVRIPFEVENVETKMVAGVFRPAGEGPFPVLIYSHGRSGTDAERSLTRIPDPRGHVRYWIKKGFAVVAPIRPGYGATHGIDHEDS